MKKAPDDIIILQMCTKNHDYMQYCSWGMAHDRHIELLFFILGYFLPFYPPNSPKNQNSKKMKKTLEISSFYTCAPKIMIRRCAVPEKWYATDRRTEKVIHRGGVPQLIIYVCVCVCVYIYIYIYIYTDFGVGLFLWTDSSDLAHCFYPEFKTATLWKVIKTFSF